MPDKGSREDKGERLAKAGKRGEDVKKMFAWLLIGPTPTFNENPRLSYYLSTLTKFFLPFFKMQTPFSKSLSSIW